MVKQKHAEAFNSQKDKPEVFASFLANLLKVLSLFKHLIYLIFLYIIARILLLALVLVFNIYYPTEDQQGDYFRVPLLNKLGFNLARNSMATNVIHSQNDCVQQSEFWVYEPKDGECSFASLFFDTKVNYSDGKRVDALKYDRAKINILLIGDSVAMGWGLNDNETFAIILEQLTGYNIDNIAFSSYNSIVELLHARKNISLRKYDLVIMQYNMNDGKGNKIWFKKNFINYKNLHEKNIEYLYDLLYIQKKGFARNKKRLIADSIKTAFKNLLIIEPRNILIKTIKYIIGRKGNKIKNLDGVFTAIINKYYDNSYPSIFPIPPMLLLNIHPLKEQNMQIEKYLLSEVKNSKFASKITIFSPSLDGFNDFYKINLHPNKKGAEAIARQLNQFMLTDCKTNNYLLINHCK